MNIRTALINLSFYSDPRAIYPNNDSSCVIRLNANGSFSVQVNWDRPSHVFPILTVDYRTNDIDHRAFVVDMRNVLKHTVHAHITSVQNLLMAFICGVDKVDDEYPTAKHEFRHNTIRCVKKTVLENHWQTTMTQYRGLSRRIKEEIGRCLGMKSHCTVILNDEAESLDYDITNSAEETTAAQLIYQRELKLADEIRLMGNALEAIDHHIFSLDRLMSNLQVNTTDTVVEIQTATMNPKLTKEDLDGVRGPFKIRNCNCYNIV